MKHIPRRPSRVQTSTVNAVPADALFCMRTAYSSACDALNSKSKTHLFTLLWCLKGDFVILAPCINISTYRTCLLRGAFTLLRRAKYSQPELLCARLRFKVGFQFGRLLSCLMLCVCVHDVNCSFSLFACLSVFVRLCLSLYIRVSYTSWTALRVDNTRLYTQFVHFYRFDAAIWANCRVFSCMYADATNWCHTLCVSAVFMWIKDRSPMSDIV